MGCHYLDFLLPRARANSTGNQGWAQAYVKTTKDIVVIGGSAEEPGAKSAVKAATAMDIIVTETVAEASMALFSTRPLVKVHVYIVWL